jgi:hypothetical protein
MAIAAAIAFAEKMKPAIVTGIHQGTSSKAHRYFILTLPIGELHRKKEAMDAVIMRTVEQIRARARLGEIVREQAELELFRKVAVNNPEAQRLIAILEGKDPSKF